jgi:hypothetical protein
VVVVVDDMKKGEPTVTPASMNARCNDVISLSVNGIAISEPLSINFLAKRRKKKKARHSYLGYICNYGQFLF